MKTPPTPHAPAPNRLFALDLLRTLACFLVIWQHVIEPYYAYPDLTIVRNADTPIVGWINSLTPIEVPLFVMISGYFFYLYDIKENINYSINKSRDFTLWVKLTVKPKEKEKKQVYK